MFNFIEQESEHNDSMIIHEDVTNDLIVLQQDLPSRESSLDTMTYNNQPSL